MHPSPTDPTPHPRYHFITPQGWLNDPNGLVYLDGEWHLFYQHNPLGIDWGHMSWGHALSRDLAHWEHLPVAIPEHPDYMIFSGSATVDWQNSGGFGECTLVAAYTAHSDGHQRQHIAFSADRGRTWKDDAHNPVVDIGARDFRDPKLFWHAATGRWVMVVSLPREHRVRFYGSPDLRAWAHLSDFGPAGASDGAWECPDFFPLRVEGAQPHDVRLRGHDEPARDKWVLKIDNGPGIDGHSGGQYFVGDFDGATFTCDDPPSVVRPLDFGSDFYAAQSWSDVPPSDGRRIWLAWMSHWAYAKQTPTWLWRGMMTLPREVSLRERAGALILIQQPARELEALRGRHWRIEDATAEEMGAWVRRAEVRGTAMEIVVELEPPHPASPRPSTSSGEEEWGIGVRTGAGEETRIGYDANAQQLFVDRGHSGNNHFSPRFDDRHAVPLALREGVLALHIFVDACSVEVFADDGAVVLSELIFPDAASDGVAAFGDARVKRMDVWELR